MIAKYEKKRYVTEICIDVKTPSVYWLYYDQLREVFLWIYIMCIFFFNNIIDVVSEQVLRRSGGSGYALRIKFRQRFKNAFVDIIEFFVIA